MGASVTLVDTSAWVQQMRPNGDPAVRARVEELLRTGQAAWCAMVRLELWNGIGKDAERQKMKAYEDAIPELPITNAVWEEAYRLASRSRAAGRTIPAADVLIAACARVHGAGLEHRDSDFDLIADL